METWTIKMEQMVNSQVRGGIKFDRNYGIMVTFWAKIPEKNNFYTVFLWGKVQKTVQI